MKTTDLKSFYYLENGEVVFSELKTEKILPKLESGFYVCECINNGGYKATLKVDNRKESAKPFDFPEKQLLDSAFEAFFNPKIVKKIKELGLIHKLAILFYGGQGNGKTTIINNYNYGFVKKHNVIVITIPPTTFGFQTLWNFFRGIRAIQNNTIVVVMEEFDQFLERSLDYSFFKTVLDGNEAIDNVIIFTSTNRIDEVGDDLKKRKSRIKYVIEIGPITKYEDVLNVVNSMVSDLYSKEECEEIANSLIGKTLDEVKHFCMDKIMDIKSYEKPKQKQIGFLSNKS